MKNSFKFDGTFFSLLLILLFKRVNWRGGSVHAAPPEDPGSFPDAHMVTYKRSSRYGGSDAVFYLVDMHVRDTQIHMHIKHLHT